MNASFLRVIPLLSLLLGLPASLVAQSMPPPPDLDPGPPPDLVPTPLDFKVVPPFNEELPSSSLIGEGQAVMLRVISSFPTTSSLQWFKDGQALAGENREQLAITAATEEDAGRYHVEITHQDGSTSSDEIEFSVAPPSRFVNLSTRAETATGNRVLVSGFVIGGAGAKSMLMRAVAPTLAADPFNVPGTIPDPSLALVQGAHELGNFDNWTEFPEQVTLDNATRSTGAFPLNAGSLDSSAVSRLAPGAYTVQVADNAGETGVTLLELYDASPGERSAALVNISSRATVGSGDNVLVPGVVIEGTAPKRVLVRAVGPSLAEFGLTDLLADPQFTILRGSEPIGSNDNWTEFTKQTELAAATDDAGAFTLADDSKDAAAIFMLEPGAYTVVVSGAGNTTGTALVELYSLDDDL